MKLSVLFKRIQHAVIQMPELEEEMEIRGITCNSQKAEEDSLFVCIQGSRVDGHDYIEEACNLGASCILIEKLVSGGRMLKFPENVAVVLVKDTREALAGISRIWFGSPADKLKVIGVTGTKGKSTVAVMIREMLESLGQKCGLIGTIGHHLGNEVATSQNTTPDAFTIQSYFAKMVEAGCHYAVMEVSSQGIKQHRIDGIWFEIAVFTNFGEDHIGPGEHASLGEYRYYKSCLFEQCRIGIGNLDDAQCSYMFQRKCCTKYGFTCREEEGQERGFRNSHVLTAEKISFLMEGGELKTVFYADDRKYELALPGKFNVYNALAALQTVSCLGFEREEAGDVLKHPLAQAVLECAARRGVQPYEVTDFKAVFGKGIEGRYAQELYFAGNEAMLAERGMALPAPVKQKLDALAGEGKTPLLFCGEKTVLGVIAVADTVKPSSAAAIADLKRMGIDVTMLTGDNRRTAEAIRRQLDIPHVIAEVLPQEKEQHVAALQQQGKTVAMVGDGINDAPALARADVGIAIGAGTDVAIESADVVLMKSDLADAVTAIRLSKAVIRNIKENLFWAFFYNTVGIPVAAGLLYLPFHLRLNPMIGAAAMSLSSVCVVMNALRLKRFKAHPAHAAAEQGASLSPMPAQPRAERIELPQNENINKNDREEKQMKTITLIIEGMMCQNCRSHVDKALNGISGVAANVSLEEKKAVCTVEDGVSADTLKAAVEDAGYTVISVE